MVILTFKNAQELDNFLLDSIKNFSSKIYLQYGNIKCAFIDCKSAYDNRYYGPAQIFNDGVCVWWYNLRRFGSSKNNYNQKKFLKDLNKQWLS